ncbi:hypothetical protein AB4589_18940, partial [Vibrio sp. 10N.222.49.A3]|uniref:hypothetical protein n=1 Tax=Vibrio sp. 10N.222.49.A3 TaxID=3229611 RepID=UPI00354F77F4
CWCGSVWLLLHYLDISSLDDDEKLLIKSNAKEHPKQQESFLKVKLKQHVSGFSYCNLQPRDFLPKISTALKNAEKLCPPDSGWEGGPFTQIPKLINALPEIN